MSLQHTAIDRFVVVRVPPNFGHPPIQQDHFTEITDPNVFGFKVAVNHPACVRISKCLARASDNFQAGVCRERRDCRFVFSRNPLQYLEKILSRDPFHDKVHPLDFIVADVVNRHGIGMLQLGRNPSLAEDTSLLASIMPCFRQQRFDGDGTPRDAIESCPQYRTTAASHLAEVVVTGKS